MTSNDSQPAGGQQTAVEAAPPPPPPTAPGTAVQEFFKGTSVLVTGATGFMGKVLVEKLLRCCPGVEAVYLLIRAKKGRSVEQRVREIFEEPVFSRVRGDAKLMQLVRAVEGDVALPGLGLSAADRSKLTQRVSVVFHVAATVRFDESLPVATATNVRGTREVMLLARDMPKLKAAIHTSTAYSQCVHSRVEERFYEAPISPAKLMELCDALETSKQDQDNITRVVIGNYPNTYVFTKAVAEQLIKDEFCDLPLAVVRPAMVVATDSEPMGGWIDNVYGPTGVAVAAAVGLLKVVHCDENMMANMVPCDMAVNCMLAAAWDVAANRPEQPPVYNYVSSTDAPITFGEYMKKFHDKGMYVPTMRSVWYYSLRLTANRALFAVYKLLMHLLPALLVDSALVLFRGQPKLLRGYRKIHRFLDVISYFTTHLWHFDNDACKALWARLPADDRRLLPFDLRGYDWDVYFQVYVRGVRVYLLKDDLDTVPVAIARWRRLYLLHTGVKLVLAAIALRVAWLATTSLTSLYGL